MIHYKNIIHFYVQNNHLTQYQPLDPSVFAY